MHPAKRAVVLGARWTPAKLGDALLAWWDAERASSLTFVSAAVAAWADLVAGYSVAQAVSGARPAYSVTGFNGRPALSFDGVDDELTLASMPFPSGAAGSEVWALVDQTALAADTTTRRIAAYGDVNNTSRYMTRGVTGGVNRAQATTGTGSSTQGSNQPAVDFSGRHVARAIFSPTTVAQELDGVTTSPVAAVPATATSRFRIGASAASTPVGFWQGQIAAVIVTGLLSTDQAGRLMAYLKARGGIP